MCTLIENILISENGKHYNPSVFKVNEMWPDSALVHGACTGSSLTAARAPPTAVITNADPGTSRGHQKTCLVWLYVQKSDHHVWPYLFLHLIHKCHRTFIPETCIYVGFSSSDETTLKCKWGIY